MNKKGQIDKIITTFPVLVLVFIIMGIFIFLAAGMKVGKGAVTPDVALGDFGSEQVLLKNVDIEGVRYSIFEGIILSENREPQSEKEKALFDKKAFYDKFVKALIDFSGKEDCLYLESSNNYFYINKGNFDPYGKTDIRPTYDGALSKLVLNYNGKDNYIYSYYGKCLK